MKKDIFAACLHVFKTACLIYRVCGQNAETTGMQGTYKSESFILNFCFVQIIAPINQRENTKLLVVSDIFDWKVSKMPLPHKMAKTLKSALLDHQMTS